MSDPSGSADLVKQLEAAAVAEAAEKIVFRNPGIPSPCTPPAPALQPSAEQLELEMRKAEERIARQEAAHKPQRDACWAAAEADAKRLKSETSARSGVNSPWVAKALPPQENVSDDELM